MWEVTYGDVVFKKPRYQIQEVTVDGFGPSSPLFELRVKIRGRLVFARREHIISNTKEGRANALSRIRQTGEHFKPEVGYLRDYGHNNSPLKELDFVEGGGLEDFTSIERHGRPQLWIFHGNHRQYSAAFRYLIWDAKLAAEIKKRLLKSQIAERGENGS